MRDEPIRFIIASAGTLASGTMAVISEHTLIPLGIFVAVSALLVTAAWKLATAVNRAIARLERVESQLDAVRDEVKQMKS